MIIMMSFDRALNIVSKKNPDRRFTGKAYQYKNAYYIEMIPKNSKGAAFDAMFRIDGNTGAVTNYNPVIDGVIKPWEMRPIR